MRQHKVLTGVGAFVALGTVGNLADSETKAPADSASQPRGFVSAPNATPTPEREDVPTEEPSVDDDSNGAARPQGYAATSEGTATAALGTLDVKPPASSIEFTRAAFGQTWYDLDRNGCDTRNDVLRRDLSHAVLKADTNGCKVLAGDLAPDPYSGEHVRYLQGGKAEVDIDHVVSLGNAWQTGAALLPLEKRRELANDPLGLLAVSASENRSKGDADAALWLPPNEGFRCAYVARQVAVKVRYGLWLTPVEHDVIAAVLQACPRESLPL